MLIASCLVLALIGFGQSVNAGQEDKTGTGTILGEIKSQKDTPDRKNTILEVLAPGEEKARSYHVLYDAKLKGPNPSVLAAVRAAKVGDRVELEWVQTGHGPAIKSLRVFKKGNDDGLAGLWTCVSATRDGKPVPEETVQQLRLTMTREGGYKTERGKQVLFDSTYKIDPGRKPKHIDLIGTEGENAGKAAQGIYMLEGDTLTICYTMPGKVRPAEFASGPGSEATLSVWKRSKP
jgi:uncharacterized protein (TIGR03067 family)